MVQAYRKEAIYRRMRHYAREHDRDQRRIDDLQAAKATYQAGMRAIESCWNQVQLLNNGTGARVLGSLCSHGLQLIAELRALMPATADLDSFQDASGEWMLRCVRTGLVTVDFVADLWVKLGHLSMRFLRMSSLSDCAQRFLWTVGLLCVVSRGAYGRTIPATGCAQSPPSNRVRILRYLFSISRPGTISRSAIGFDDP